MTRVALVTFHSGSETYTPAFEALATALNQQFPDLEVLVFVEQLGRPGRPLLPQCRELLMPGLTKFERLLHVVRQTQLDFVLCVDNDIRSDIPKTVGFVQAFIKSKADMGWGKVMAQESQEMVGRLVQIDKLLSHKILRPLLWRAKVGVSVPGQCFLIRRAAFENHMYQFNTFLDDISFGLFVRMNRMRVFITSDVLGYERPNTQSQSLFKQRRRWAHGLSSIVVRMAHSPRALLFLLLHLFAYHLLWIPYWLLLLWIAKLHVIAALICLVLTVVGICGKGYRLAPSAMLYLVYFPVLHIYWLFHFVRFYVQQLREVQPVG